MNHQDTNNEDESREHKGQLQNQKQECLTLYEAQKQECQCVWLEVRKVVILTRGRVVTGIGDKGTSGVLIVPSQLC